MRPTHIVNNTVTLVAIQERLSYKISPEMEKKLLAIQLLLLGKTHKEVYSLLKIGRNTLTRWIHIININGLDGLFPTKKVGRPSKLAQNEQDFFINALGMSPATFGFKAQKWSGKVFVLFLKKHSKNRIAVSTGYKIYKNLSAKLIATRVESSRVIDNALSNIIKIYRVKIVQKLVS